MDFLIIFILLSLLIYSTAEHQDCLINIEYGMTKGNRPIILTNTDEPVLLYGTNYQRSAKVIKIHDGTSARIFCTPSTDEDGTTLVEYSYLFHSGVPSAHMGSPMLLTCNNKELSIDGNKITLSDLECNIKPSSVMELTTMNCTVGHIYRIGFYVDEGSFLQTIDLCFDEFTSKTFWSHTEIQPTSSRGRQIDRKFDFKRGPTYIWHLLDPVNIYNIGYHLRTLTELVGRDLAEYYIPPKEHINADPSLKLHQLKRGHLIANADMVYHCEQESTFFMANTAPQWQIINSHPGNWARVELYIRRYAERSKSSIEAWAGTINVASIADGFNVTHQFWLHDYERELIDDRSPLVPVPAVFYKCILNKKSFNALCFVTVNNPYVTIGDIYELHSPYKVCDMIMDCPIKDLESNMFHGFTYCCDIVGFLERNHEELGLTELRDYVHTCGRFSPIDFEISTELINQARD